MPEGKIKAKKAFWRNAPAVRFIERTTVLTGDLLLEWLLSSRSSCFVQGRRDARLFFAFLRYAIALPLLVSVAVPVDVKLA